jgi:hypothetical protein
MFAFPSLAVLRASALAVAAVVGAYALWFLAAEITRPHLPFFAVNNAEVTALVESRRAAVSAASLALIRSDLWTDAAMALAARSNSASDPAAINATAPMLAATEWAIALGPHDARAWLLLAAFHTSMDGLNRTIVSPLKMSYYTGPNEAALFPMRLLIAIKTAVVSDPEIQGLVAGDIRTILLYRPDMRSAIITASRQASPASKAFLRKTVELLDSNFAAQLDVSATQ